MDAVTRVSQIYDTASAGPDLIKVYKKKEKGRPVTVVCEAGYKMMCLVMAAGSFKAFTYL